MEYNGWTNRETWAAMLHIDNDEGLLLPLLEVAQRNENAREVAEEVEAFITEDVLNFDNVSTNRNAFLMLTDIGSLYRVNWQEIAQSLLDNVKERVSA
jgi:hypothetical protein